MRDAPDITPTGCTYCAQRITGEGMPSFCSDGVQDRSSLGRFIKPADIANGPAWCPKKGSAA